MEKLTIGNKSINIPIFQGGMGVGVSRSSLAGAVAAEGGVGVISTAQIGYDEPEFQTNQIECNLQAIEKHIKIAKKKAKGGLVGVNIMVAIQQYAGHVKAAVKAGADVIICGAGLPMELPALVGESDTKIAPIISTERAQSLLLKMWDKHYHKTADFIVIEGPKAGGHLGFSYDQLVDMQNLHYDDEIRKIIEAKKVYEDKYERKIPIIVAGGIFDQEDVAHALALGADGVQIASRFVVTEECDAAPEYKQAYINATEADLRIIKSPVGMPGRAIHNHFLDEVEKGNIAIERCYSCIKKCDPAKIPYCITKALIDAVQGDVENGLIFAGANVGRLKEMTTVHQIFQELNI